MTWNKVFEETMSEVKKTAEAFPWEDKEAYTQWLAQTYHFVIHTTRILTLASTRTPMDQEQLHNRFIDHAKEERSHEKLLINDLKHLGKDVNYFGESASAAAIYKTQYYCLEYQSTRAFMGWVVFLEAFAAQFGPGILERIIKAHGKEASVFWKVHAEEDQDHVQKAFKQIADIPENERQPTIDNFVHSAFFYTSMLKECQTTRFDR